METHFLEILKFDHIKKRPEGMIFLFACARDRLLSSDGCLIRDNFFEVMKSEMRNYISRQIGRHVCNVDVFLIDTCVSSGSSMLLRVDTSF